MRHTIVRCNRRGSIVAQSGGGVATATWMVSQPGRRDGVSRWNDGLGFERAGGVGSMRIHAVCKRCTRGG